MPKKRTTVYIDENLKRQVKAKLKGKVPKRSFSSTIEELLVEFITRGGKTGTGGQ